MGQLNAQLVITKFYGQDVNGLISYPQARP